MKFESDALAAQSFVEGCHDPAHDVHVDVPAVGMGELTAFLTALMPVIPGTGLDLVLEQVDVQRRWPVELAELDRGGTQGAVGF